MAQADRASATPKRATLSSSHLPRLLSRLAPLRATSLSSRINIEFALKPRNADQIQPLLNRINNPQSPDYGHYLTPEEYRSRFSPSQDDIAKVVAYARSQGLSVTHVSQSGMLVRASGTAAQIGRAFGVTLHDYISPDPRDKSRVFHAPDREPTLDPSVAPLLNGIVGLSNAAVPHNDLRKPAQIAGITGRSAPPARAPQAAALKPDAVKSNVTGGEVSGFVVDYNGNALPGATVQLANTSSSGKSPAVVTSDSGGNFQFNNVAVGTYNIYAYSGSYNASQTFDDNSNPIETVTVTTGSNTEVGSVLYISLDSSDIRSIYGLTSSLQSYSGQNQVLGLVEFDSYSASDITTFEQQYKLTGSYPAITNISVDGADPTAAPYYQDDADEVELDLDMLLNLAYNAKQIRVYEAPASVAYASDDGFSGEFADIFDAMANDSTRASVISCSWGQSEDGITQADANAEATALQQLALQGQTFCAASGDEGAYDDGSTETPNVDDPGAQPTVVCCGGTDLTANFTHSTDTGTIASQSSWWDPYPVNEQPPIGIGGGGGISAFWSIPSWQVGSFSASVNPQGSATMRNTPDISLYASPDYGGYNIYVANDGGYEPVAGTSAAAPLWAAMIADANVERIASGKPALGMATPEIYEVAKSSAYGTDFYDINDNSNNGYFPAVTGYDNSTGWGSPLNGSHMIADLASAATPSTTTTTTRFDFNRDGHADLIWYNTGSGAISVWDMNDTSALSYGSAFAQLAPSTGWQPVAAPDVNNDGSPDLIWWNNQTGELSAWTMQNTTVLSYGADFGKIADTHWKPVAAADVTGTTWELVFQNTATGDISAWQMNGTSVVSYGGTIASLGAGSPWQVVGAPDLNGDGKSDLLFWNSSTGEVSYWSCDLSAGSVLAYHGDISQVADTSYHLMGSEDTNGDGHSDLIWWNANTGAESRWLMNGTTVAQYGGTTAQVADTTWQPTAIR